MTRTSVLTLLAASLMVVSPTAFAQVSVGTDVNATQTVDANGDGNVSADEQAAADAAASASGDASAEASATAGLQVDANGDGTISAEEVTAANAAIEASGNASIVLDANGDGTVTVEEAAAAQAALGAAVAGDTVACEAGGLPGMMSGMKMAEPATITAATNVRVVLVSNCSADEVTSALATEGATNIRGALQANAAAVAAIKTRGATMADVLGATAEGNTVTVYVASAATAS